MIFEIYGLNINTCIDQHKLEFLMNKLPDESIRRIRSFYKQEDSLRTLGGELLVRYMIYKYRDIPLSKICISRGEYGKPYLKNDCGLHFNISHSGQWIVAAISESPVGIDIQEIEDFQIELDLLKHFSKNERHYIMNQEDKLNCFYDLWTLKESYIKAIGMGLFKSLDSFSIYINDNSIEIDSKNPSYYFKQYEFIKNYKLAVCSLSNDFPDVIKLIEWEELYNSFLGLDVVRSLR